MSSDTFLAHSKMLTLVKNLTGYCIIKIQFSFSFRGASPPWAPDQGLCPWIPSALAISSPLFRRSRRRCLPPAPLKLRPNGAIEIYYCYYCYYHYYCYMLSVWNNRRCLVSFLRLLRWRSACFSTAPALSSATNASPVQAVPVTTHWRRTTMQSWKKRVWPAKSALLQKRYYI